MFEGQSGSPFARLLHRDFRHCFAAVLDERGYWISLDGQTWKDGLPELRVVGGASDDLAAHYRAHGCRVVELDAPRHPPRTVLMLATCVGATKRLLGLRAPFVFTPWQLYRRLERNPR